MSAFGIAHARRELGKLGFTFPALCTNRGRRWGNMPAEPVNVGKDHFKPRYRDVYISTRMSADGGFFYITSHVKGQLRRHRCREWQEAERKNVFGAGKTLEAAVAAFVKDFKTKVKNPTEKTA